MIQQVLPEKRVLMICYYYPPLLDVGSLRSIAFSERLWEYGWIPTVITVANPDSNFCKVGDVDTPAGVEVLRTRNLFNVSHLIYLLNGILVRVRRLFFRDRWYGFYVWAFRACVPDVFLFWIPLTVRGGVRAHRERSFHAIYASCSPLSSAIIGALIKRVTKVPLILDFRDAMSPKLMGQPSGFWGDLREKIERWALGHCDHFIAVTEEVGQRYEAEYPFLVGRISFIRNGFSQTFAERETVAKKTERFTLVYAGNYYHDLIDHEPFFRALREAIDSNAVKPTQVVFRYVGAPAQWLTDVIQKYRLEDQVEVAGYVSREVVKSHLIEADVVVLRVFEASSPTKLYEALALGKVCLGMVQAEESRRLILKYSPASRVSDPLDFEGIRESVVSLYQLWKVGSIRDQVSPDFLREFSWATRSRQLADMLDSIVSRSRENSS